VLLLSQKNRQHTVIRSDLLKHVQTCRNTFQSVQINPFKPVETRYNPFKHVSPPSPSSIPPSPLFGGGEGEGEGVGEGGDEPPPPPPKTPGRGRGGTKSPPPPPDFNNKKTIKILALFLLQNLCNLPTLKVSLSPPLLLLLLLKTT
jgi:hypothetical protein